MPPRKKDLDTQKASVRIVHLTNLFRVDWLMSIFVLGLAVLGFLTLYSACGEGSLSNFWKQVVYFVMGACVAAVLICTDYRFLVGLGPLIYLAVLGLLVGVLIFGIDVKGSTRWFDLGVFRLQPSEVAKVGLIYALTWYFVKLGDRIRKIWWFFITFIIVAIPMALILKQPDLGTAACLAPLVVVMLFVAGCRVRHLLAIILVGLSILPYAWLQMKDFKPDTEEYLEANTQAKRDEIRAAQKAEFAANRKPWDLHWHQCMRIYTFLHPESDPTGGGWQTTQSKITVGSGGLTGKGYLKGEMTRLKYLPMHFNDFIFSSLAEERGFVGATIVIGCFLALLLRGLMFARDCPEMGGTLLACGAVTILAFHVFINIGITIGLLPVTGLPLPFLSYGGSFYLATMALVGTLLSVPMRKRVFVY